MSDAIRLRESHARMVAAIKLLAAVVEGKLPKDTALPGVASLLAQSEEWMGRSDDEVRSAMEHVTSGSRTDANPAP